jgi:hypothetical protein
LKARRQDRLVGRDLAFADAGDGVTEQRDRAAHDQWQRRPIGEAEAIRRWTLHDLRRTGTTGMARLKIAPHVVDRILNHTGGTIRGVAAVYNRFEYLEERRAALEAWGRFVEGLITPPAANVIAFPG